MCRWWSIHQLTDNDARGSPGCLANPAHGLLLLFGSSGGIRRGASIVAEGNRGGARVLRGEGGGGSNAPLGGTGLLDNGLVMAQTEGGLTAGRGVHAGAGPLWGRERSNAHVVRETLSK